MAEPAAHAAGHGACRGRDSPGPYAEGGRGLLIVEALADRWGVVEGPVPRKTVWAELDLVP